MDLKAFTQSIEQLAEEKGIPKETIIETIEAALAAAYKRDYGRRGQIIRAALNPATGKVSFRQIKIVVDESMIKSEEEILEEERLKESGEFEQEHSRSKRRDDDDTEIETAEGVRRVRFNPEKHIILDEAKTMKQDAKVEDEIEFLLPDEPVYEYGRIAAQTAKQVIIQRIREAEREAVFNEFKSREGEIVSGLVQRIEGRNIYIDIGRTVGIMPPEEQIPGERLRIGERIKTLISLVEKNPRGSGIFLSRSHPKLLRKLFEIEVPEIASGGVEIKAVAREAGSRSKIAVVSHEDGVDPVGALVGQKGVRVMTVISEAGGEKIDIIEWSDDPGRFIAHALSPAKVINVEIDEHRKEARAIVPDDQLSLAIGKGGQNVRLAAKLTGWKIDVRSQKGADETPAEQPVEELDKQQETKPKETTSEETHEEK
jgi:N utilization substance protein A